MRGGYNFVRDGANPLIVRMRMIHDARRLDQCTMLTVLTRLGLITGEGAYGGRAQALIASLADEISRNFISCGELLNGFEYFLTGVQIVVLGARGNPAPRNSSMRCGAGHFPPGCWWWRIPPMRCRKAIRQGQNNAEWPATAYICQRGNCSPLSPALLP